MFRQSLWRRMAPVVDPMTLAPLQRFTQYLAETDAKTPEFIGEQFHATFFPKYAAMAAAGEPALQAYCRNSVADVPPLVSLLMRVFGDSNQLDQLRFVFALALREVPLTVELLNVYLIALTRFDCFTAVEVQNVEDLIREASELQLNLVSRACLIELKVRMGHPFPRQLFSAWQGDVLRCIEGCKQHEKGSAVAAGAFPAGFKEKSKDFFMVMLRSHESSKHVVDALMAFHFANPEQITVSHYLNVLLRFARDESATPADIAQVLSLLLDKTRAQAADDQFKDTISQQVTTGADASTSGSPSSSRSVDSLLAPDTIVPVHSSSGGSTALQPIEDVSALVKETLHEKTMLQILAKCMRHNDLKTALSVIAFIKAHALVADENKEIVSMVMLTLYSATDALGKALDIVEDELKPESCQLHVGRIREPFRGDPLKAMLFDVQPVARLLTATLRRKVKSVDEAFYCLERRHQDKKPVTAKTLDIIVAACAELRDESRAIETLEAYPNFGVKPNANSYTLLLKVCSGSDAEELSEKHANVLKAMQRAGVAPEFNSIKGMLAQALEANDISCALRTIQVAKEMDVKLDDQLVRVLISRLLALKDFESVIEVCQVLRSVRSSIHRLKAQPIIRSLRSQSDPTATEALNLIHEVAK